MIAFKRISLSFSTKPVLRDINLQLPAGKTHVLLGRSGSGKTTLLKILIGILRPDSGGAHINDRSVVGCDPQQIGYIPQDGGLFPHLTNFANITLVAKARGWQPSGIQARFATIAPLVSLRNEIFSKYPQECSGGERQRIAILRALFLDPPILVLDEPLSALDPLVRSQLQGDLKELFNNLKKTVIIVTHDLAEAAFFGHSISLLRNGELVQTGTFEDLRDRPAHQFVTEFIQSQRALEIVES